ncbi:hypothetical protein [Pantoea ananatis]
MIKQFDNAVIGEKRRRLLMSIRASNPALTGYVCFDSYMQF